MVQFVVAILLYFVIFFGVAFILNMLLRQTWLMAFLYPIFVVIMVDNQSTTEYFKAPKGAFNQAWDRIVGLTPADIAILTGGFAGTIVCAFVIKFLRKSGYQMF